MTDLTAKHTKGKNQMYALVIARHTMDDIPLKLCTGPDAMSQARAFIAAAEFNEDSRQPEYWDCDATTPQVLAIVQFDDDGNPTELNVVRDLDRETPEAPA